MVRECDVASRHLQGCSLHLCQLWTNGLDSMSKYWTYWLHARDMGLISWCTLSSTNVWLKPTASIVVLEEKLRRVPWATQPGWEVESGALFLRSSSIRPMLLMTCERLLYTDHVKYVWSRAIRRPSVECVWCIDQVSPIGCTSIWITVILRYEYRLFAAVIM
jgi:hypothetical protein